MGEFKGTPGPWFAAYGGKEVAVHMIPASEGWLRKNEVCCFERNDEGIANAQAIAAVPEMIKALKSAEQYIELSIWDAREIHGLPEDTIKIAENDLEKVRTVLSKALGEETK